MKTRLFGGKRISKGTEPERKEKYVLEFNFELKGELCLDCNNFSKTEGKFDKFISFKEKLGETR